MTAAPVIGRDDRVVVTGAAGFLGARVVAALQARGYRRIACLVRSPGHNDRLASMLGPETTLIHGNLLSREHCRRMADGAALVIHLAAGRGKSFPACFQNSVVATRNMVEAVVAQPTLKRFVNVSSFSVYSMTALRRGAVLDESCPLEDDFMARGDAYGYAKRKQDDIVAAYRQRQGLPAVTVRPSVVMGPGKAAIPAHVGISTFGFFMHIGGSNPVPLTDVDNCADAIVRAGLTPGIEGEVFNIVDDDLPTSRSFLRQYRRRVGRFRAVPVPAPCFRLFCLAWERYVVWSEGQLPPAFNRRYFDFFWKPLRYSNSRLKQRLGWNPVIPMDEALERYFRYQAEVRHA